MSKTPRKTPAQVKAKSAARKDKPKPTSTPVKEDSPKPISTTEIEIPNEIPIREATPDIIRKSPVKEAAAPISAPIVDTPENTELNGGDSLEETPSKKIIQS